MSQLRPLNAELEEIACRDLNEINDNIPQDLQSLRAWLEKQPHLKSRTDDQFLIAFLRFCKYNLESAEQRIDYFYTYKTTAKDLLKTRRIDEKILELAQSDILYTLPKPAGGPGGPRIHVTLMGNINPSQHSVADIFRYHIIRSEIEINTDDNWNISGVIEIVDFSKIPFAFLKQFELGLFKQMSAILEHGIPTNLMGTHIVNASREVQIIMSLIRTVMKQKELLHVHPNLDSLQQAIGKEYLPVEYGGSNGTLKEAAENYEKLLLSFKSYFDEDEQYGVDEKLRQGANVSDKASGFFRKFIID